MLFHAILVGFDTELNMRYSVEQLTGMQTQPKMRTLRDYIDPGFFIFYTMEPARKLVAWRFRFSYAESWGWNIFSVILVISGYMDVFKIGTNLAWMRTIKGVSRIVRTFRMTRIVKYFRELRVLILSLWYSLR